MSFLRIKYDSGRTSELPLEGERLVLGRAADNNISCPSDSALSRRHVVFEREQDGWTASDLGSQNGTLLNGEKLIARTRLLSGDVIVAGRLVLSYIDAKPHPAPKPSSLLTRLRDPGDETIISQIGAVKKRDLSHLPLSNVEQRPTGFAWVSVLTGPTYGTRLALPKDFLIGRDRDCALVIHDKRVSRHHAHIVLENARFFLYVIGRNGLFVNEIRAGDRQELRDRDEIQIGDTLLRFHQAASADSITTRGKKRLRDFGEAWKDLTAAARLDARDEFVAGTRRLIGELLAESLGFTPEKTIEYYCGTAGFMVQAPTLQIRRPHFPVLVVAYDENDPNLRDTVKTQLARARANDYFALFIVVPTSDTSVDAAESLRQQVLDKVARQDLVVLDQQHLAELIGGGSPERLLKIILKQGIDLAALSPYITAGAVSNRMFFGREKEIKHIRQTLQQGDYALPGPRRIGKSSVLHRLTHLFNEDRAHYSAVPLNCETVWNYGEFLEATAEALDSKTVRTEPRFFTELVQTEKKRLGESALIFLLDEVDQLLDFDSQRDNEWRLFKTFRSLSHGGVCRFVFSGSRVLYEQLRSGASPLFNFCEHAVLKTLDEETVAELVKKPLSQLGIGIEREPEVIRRIVEITSCHPNLTQWICDRLLKNIEWRSLTLSDLDNVINAPDFADHYLSTCWGNADPLERLITLVTETPTFTEQEIFDALARLGIIDDTAVKRALNMLDVGIVVERRGDIFHFRMARFPMMARQHRDVRFEIESLVREVKR